MTMTISQSAASTQTVRGSSSALFHWVYAAVAGTLRLYPGSPGWVRPRSVLTLAHQPTGQRLYQRPAMHCEVLRDALREQMTRL